MHGTSWIKSVDRDLNLMLQPHQRKNEDIGAKRGTNGTAAEAYMRGREETKMKSGLLMGYIRPTCLMPLDTRSK